MDAMTGGGSTPPSTDESLTRRVEEAQAQILRAIQLGNLKNDPLAPILEAISSSLGVQHQLHTANSNMRRELGASFRGDMADAIKQARQPIDAASLKRVEEAAGAGVSRHAAALVKAYNWRTVLIASGAVVGVMIASISGGYWWGRTNGIQQFSTAEAGFTSMFHDDPGSATGWLGLVRLNDYRQVIAGCRGARVFVEAGQQACTTALWLKPRRAEPAAQSSSAAP